MANAYYNENDPHAAAWLRELISRGLIAPGDVDERSIADVRPDDLTGYTQCHFFAGIGGWSYALRLAGWPEDRPVWTGSCPCQPFSSAGKRAGVADERHLWPAWHRLISECRPGVVFGEQVASRDGYGWLDSVWADMEEAGYAFGPVVLPACSVGAPHIRHRIWFVGVADADDSGQHPSRAEGRPEGHNPWRRCEHVPLADGTARPAPPEPAFQPLAYGLPARVVRLRGYGNAIVPQVAAAFVSAYLETEVAHG